MNYPVWYLPAIGGGSLIALIAVTHVFVAHFAVGGGLFLVLSEKKGLREKSSEILDFTKMHAKFFLLITMVYGAITGVGIWWIIALVNPAATSLLIHNFVFGWAAEWVFFMVEIVAAFIYFYTFGKMKSRAHVQIGWMYFFSAWMSLVLINGIVAFMLTPGQWVEDHNFWSGFLNPSFLPSLIFRTFLAILMAGAYGYLTASFSKSQTVRHAMTRFSARWCLVALAGIIPSSYWYLKMLPVPAQALVMGKSPTIAIAKQWGLGAFILIMCFSLIAGLKWPRLNNKFLSTVAFVAAFLIMGSFEWIREAARRPYVINEVMYSNMIYVDQVPGIISKGFLNMAKWVQHRQIDEGNRINAGREMFVHQCYACHTLGGLNNDLIKQTANMSYGAMVSYLGRLHKIRYFMPPFAGTNEEARALAAFIVEGLHNKPIDEKPDSMQKISPGMLLFEENCSSCHTTDDMKEFMSHRDRQTIRKILDQLDQLSDEMPPFERTNKEKDQLAEYLHQLKEAGDE